jgi:hypothetical protein
MPMRIKRPLALLNLSILLEIASHAAMGVALGLGFAFILTHIAALGIVALINVSGAPEDILRTFMLTCVTTFGIGAAFTGIAFMTMRDRD